MAYVWVTNRHGPFVDPWEGVFAYEQGAWASALAPRSEEGAEALRWFGFAMALLSIRYALPTVIFAALYVHHIFVAVTNFANHPYLFVLLAVLTSCAACDPKHVRAWRGALRGQIVIVYAFASLWKLTPRWLDGTIVRGIFTSFEEQGVARGIPWKSIDVPEVWFVIALGGFMLDFTLFLVLWLGPPGHWLQWTCLLFHGFTSFTMSQRIGYSFPLAMILSTVLFVGQERVRLYNHLHHQKASSIVSTKSTAATTATTMATTMATTPLSRRLLVGVWIALQVIMPLRMPFISRGEYAYTAEGYRFSWTMMLHSKAIIMSPNQFTGNLRPTCNHAQWPTSDRVPFQNLIGLRGMAALSMFPRILPKLSYHVGEVLEKSCPGGQLRVYADWFASVDDGPYVRLVDPTVNMLDVYAAQRNRSWIQAAIGIATDKPTIEYLLYNVSASELVVDQVLEMKGNERLLAGGVGNGGEGGALYIDRSRCLSFAPIRFYNVEWMRLTVLLSDPTSRMWYRVGELPPQPLERNTPVTLQFAQLVLIGAVRPTTSSGASHLKHGTVCAGSPIDTVVNIQMVKSKVPVVVEEINEGRDGVGGMAAERVMLPPRRPKTRGRRAKSGDRKVEEKDDEDDEEEGTRVDGAKGRKRRRRKRRSNMKKKPGRNGVEKEDPTGQRAKRRTRRKRRRAHASEL
jgi:hypothetical protein